MESTLDTGSCEPKSEVVGEKRRPDEDGGQVTEAPPTKRIKGGSERGSFGDVRKVAEIVLVLAAMGKIRGGMGPSGLEKELLEEARNSLVKVCQGFAPKDVFPRDAFGGIIEDLGLNKMKEQKMGFRPPKLSIAQKLLVSKRKMEKTEVFPLPSTPNLPQRLQGNSGPTVESRSALHHVRMSQPDKSTHISVTSGVPQSASAFLGRGSTTNSTSLPYQLPSSEIRPAVSSALPSSHLVPKVDRPNLTSDGRSNGSSHASQVQSNPNYSVKSSSQRTQTWPMQPQSASPAKIGSHNKVPPVNISFDVKSGPPLQGTNTHAEIGKIVQKLLQPHIPEQRTWIPPSREYMSKALTCQMCMSTVTDIDSILICDACEKGYHLKCLQATNQKGGVPRGEWHCGKCLSLTNGKPVPPKYGRVMRNMTMSNVSSSTPTAVAGTSTSNKQVGVAVAVADDKVSGNNSVRKVPTVSKAEDAKGMQENDTISKKGETDDKVSSERSPNNMIKVPNSGCIPSMNSKPVEELKPNHIPKLEMVPDSSDRPPVTQHSDQDGNLPNGAGNIVKRSLQNHVMVSDSKELNLSHDPDKLKENVVRDNSSEIASNSEFMNQERSSSDGMHAVNWVGDPLQVLDEKIYYASCSINGHVYKVTDHVLIHFDKDKLVPSKLQAMWEDKHSTSKWVKVNKCYFPVDLPEAVGRPCGLESDEVFESTCSTTVMAGLIKSRCEVLPPRKFAEESEKRSRSASQQSDCLHPLYLCNWIFDESKGLFRDISS